MIGKSIISALALVALSDVAQALTPLPPCNGEEGGMKVYDAWSLGYDDSGFVSEGYVNLDKDGVIAAADGPVPALNNFNGTRITDCRTGRMLALDGVFQNDMDVLSATEFLRAKVQGEKRIRMGDIEKAAQAVWGKKQYVRIIRLRETEETCACGEYFPGLWK